MYPYYNIKVTFKNKETINELNRLLTFYKDTLFNNSSNQHYTKSELEFYLSKPSLPSRELTQTNYPTYYRQLKDTKNDYNLISHKLGTYLDSNSYRIDTLLNYIFIGQIYNISEYMFYYMHIDLYTIIPYRGANRDNSYESLYACNKCNILTTSAEYYNNHLHEIDDHHLCHVCNGTSNDQKIKDAQIAYKLLTT